MAPEAYTLKSALDGWIAGESNEQIRDRAAGAYDKYQKCGFRAAQIADERLVTCALGRRSKHVSTVRILLITFRRVR
jgi:hypothetical protein